MQLYKGICNECKKPKWINNSKGICPGCVYKKNHGGRSAQEVQMDKQKAKERVFKSQKIKIKKPTGEYELFLEIWGEREHRCENCKGWLSENVSRRSFVKYFSHQKSKGAYPELRLEKSNIELNCHTCHDLWEFGDREMFYQRKDMYL